VFGYPTSDTPRAEGRQAIRTAYERFLKPRPDVASSEYDNLHRAFIDKTLECSLLKLKLFITCAVCYTNYRMRRLLSLGPPNYAIQETYKSWLDR
jgi:hypothetical protein